MLRRLHDELADKKIELRVVGAHSKVRDRLRFEKLQDWVGPINRHVSLGEAVAISMQPGRAQEATFVPDGFLRWLNDVRPPGQPELSHVPLTVEGVADAIEKRYRDSVNRWGGPERHPLQVAEPRTP
jgi:hypothetical protein